MKPGELVIIDGGSHMYPDGWIRGENPLFIGRNTAALVLEAAYEADVVNPRLFLRVLCPLGVGKINSAWCKAVKSE